MELYQSIFERSPDTVLVVDKDGGIAKANARAAQMFGYDSSELIGRSAETLIPQFFSARHLDHRAGHSPEPRVETIGAGVDLYARRKDETEFPVELMLSALQTDEGTFVLAIVHDITERKLAEGRIIESLREKEALLKEIHHRVKNNLAVISSLFYLQSTHTQDEETLRTLQEGQDRIQSMALVHETLYQSGNFAELDFAEYTQVLSDQLNRTYSLAAGNIRLDTDLEEVNMSMDMAVPCGLILTELVSNALKHAFPNGQHGRIVVSLRGNGTGGCLLRVTDNGIGIQTDVDTVALRSRGLRMIRSLAGQLDAHFELIPNVPGVDARLTFQVHRDNG